MNTPISFELAKLLKEKGFDLYCQHSYWKGELTLHTPGYALKDGTTSQANYFNFERYYAPTIAEVVMWIYEKHRIWINAWSDTNLNLPEWKDKAKWFYVINCDLISCYDDKGKNKQLFNSPTKAYEAAIEYTLKNLI